MNIMITVCNPKQKSFNHAIAQTVTDIYNSENNTLFYHDLYAEKFDPLLLQGEIDKKTTEGLEDYVQKTCAELLQADVMVIIHPNWWGQPPALLKGWVDRIFRRGVAYKFDSFGRSIGMLENKKVFIFNTSNTPEVIEMGMYNDPLDNLWKNCIFGMCGVHDVKRLMFKEVIRSTEKNREDWLNQVREIISEEDEI